jgi:hypothetical protein
MSLRYSHKGDIALKSNLLVSLFGSNTKLAVSSDFKIFFLCKTVSLKRWDASRGGT